MAVNVMVDGEGSVVESEERWQPVPEVPYILNPEDAKNLRGTVRGKPADRVAAWKRLQPLFSPEVWQQVLAHIEGMES